MICTITKKETGIPFTMTTKMAIDDVKNERNIVTNYREKMSSIDLLAKVKEQTEKKIIAEVESEEVSNG